ncbi:MAG: ribosome silencing factor [Treponema sp.]|jgi:ribosome-associated protein|nr:ribosome silencing factor [Treponema sp.]
MEDMLPETEALALGELLHEHRGADVCVLDLREMNAWTDFFVIATASSNTHLDGMERHIKEFCRERGLDILRRSRKPENEDDEWRLIDLGSIVIHLMNGRARSFYELERLYSQAREISTSAHSSNSSKSSSSSSSSSSSLSKSSSSSS